MTDTGALMEQARQKIAGLGAVLTSSLAVGACDAPPTRPVEATHGKHLTATMIGQRTMYCDDGTRVDVDFVADRMTMAVTWPPEGRTEILRVQRTADEFRGANLHAVVAGGSIAFTRGGQIRVCHRTPEEG